MDDIVVKTKDKATLVQDLEETFTNLHKINLKLNPEKCVFGVPSGKLLGFFVSHRQNPLRQGSIPARLSPRQGLMPARQDPHDRVKRRKRRIWCST